jgi:tRNA A22 N-methylase
LLEDHAYIYISLVSMQSNSSFIFSEKSQNPVSAPSLVQRV